MCDIDHFKQINDARGHAAGDDVLQQFAARAQKSIRTNSDWVARYGGEEFLIVLPETPYEGAVARGGEDPQPDRRDPVRDPRRAMPWSRRASASHPPGPVGRTLRSKSMP